VVRVESVGAVNRDLGLRDFDKSCVNDCDSVDILAQLCHSNPCLQAAFLVMFSRRD